MLLRFLFFLGVFALLSQSCISKREMAKVHNFPKPVDTKDHPVTKQIHKTYGVNGVYADNEFEGARLNDFVAKDDSTFIATISPENYPINISAYYGFRLRADQARDVTIELHYTHHEHRYVPKISYDGENWTPLDHSQFDTIQAPNICTIRLTLDENPLFLCAQELKASPQIKSWAMTQDAHPDVTFSIVGKSKWGRDMMMLDISDGDIHKKPTIIVLSRQHPPEVTGYMAMESFVEEILKDNALSNAFRKKFRIMVFPLMNPDGVDEGHWRHNGGGIDLNRDWSSYQQDETRLVANHIVKSVYQNKNKVLLGLDFHSTQEDIYYTLPDNRHSVIYPFKNLWLESIEQSIEGYETNDSPDELGSPITKFWFYLQFGAEGITYEIGDETPRPFIRQKGKVAAQEMMQLLILN